MFLVLVMLSVLLGVGAVVYGLRSGHFIPYAFGSLLTLVALVASLGACVNRACVGGEIAQLEALRYMTAAAPVGAAHEIYGQASEANQNIMGNQWGRRQWWARDFISARWDTVSVIVIPSTIATTQ